MTAACRLVTPKDGIAQRNQDDIGLLEQQVTEQAPVMIERGPPAPAYLSDEALALAAQNAETLESALDIASRAKGPRALEGAARRLAKAPDDFKKKPWKRNANGLHVWGVTVSGMSWYDVGHPDLVAFKTYTTTFALPYRLGRGHFLLKNFEQALAQFIPLADHTDDVTVFTHICICAVQLGELALAKESYEAGIALAPNDPDWIKIQAILKSAGAIDPSES